VIRGALVDFAEANLVGQEGEESVSRELLRLARQHAIRPLSNVLLEEGPKTAQIDHIVVDDEGVVVVETKCWRAALVRGKSADTHWTACYPGDRRESFLNPLRQNAAHIAMLQRVLRARGFDLPSDVFTNAVVFADGDVAHLELESDPLTVVLTVDGFMDLLVTRQLPRGSRPRLASGLPLQIFEAIQEVDSSGDPEAKARHHARMAGRREPKPARPRPRLTTWKRSQPASYERPFDRTRKSSSIASLAAVAMGAALVVVMLFGGGVPWFANTVQSLMRLTAPPSGSGPAPSTPAASPDVSLARRVLKDSDPKTYARVTDLDSPTLGTARGIPTYTWHYTEKIGSDKVRVRSLTMAIDPSGVLRGITRE
jgi:hypothetical protein